MLIELAPMEVVSIPYFYFTSLYHSVRQRRLFDGVETFFMFLGYPRSAHTLVGFLLDAHPNMIVASQMNTLKYYKHGFKKGQIYHLLTANSRRVAEAGRGHRNYSYAVPNQWQGRFEILKAIGDSTGLTRVRKNPALLKSLQGMLQPVRLKLIHCVRNPYDNISTMKIRSGRTLEQSVEDYFEMCDKVEAIQRELGAAAIHTVRHESLIAEPKGTLKELCAALGVAAGESYCDDCASILYKSPHKSRIEVPWSRDLIAHVEDRLNGFPFLQGYTYEDDSPREGAAPKTA